MYRPLDSEGREIRLVRPEWLHRDNNWIWQLEMKYVSLASVPVPPFITLSYVWNELTNVDRNKYFVEIACSRLPITSNLHSALTSIFHNAKLKENWWWIDAISVNQDDLEERASQVGLMKVLYGQSSKTIAFLGQQFNLSDTALEWIEKLHHQKMQPNPGAWIAEAAKPPRYSKEWKALDLLLARPYWSRAWIMQECILPPVLEFLCGSIIISADTVKSALHFLRVAGSLIMRDMWSRGIVNANGTSLRFKFIQRRFHLRVLYQEGNRVELWHLLQYLGDFYASDPRDYIYALVRLSQDGEALVPSPSYIRSVAAIYTDFVISYIKHYDRLDIICMGSLTRSSEEIPSWVPDWAARDRPGSPYITSAKLMLTKLIQDKKAEAVKPQEDPKKPDNSAMPKIILPYQASGSLPPSVEVNEELTRLVALGIYIDCVDGIAGGSTWIINKKGYMEKISTLPGVQPNNPTSAYGTLEETKEAIWRTFLSDRLEPYQPAPAYGLAFLANNCAEADVGRGHESWVDVWDIMKTFQVAGTTLQEWFSDNPKNLQEENKKAMERHTQSLPLQEQATVSERPAAEGAFNILAAMGKRFITTESGYMGLAPAEIQRGDEIWVLYGCALPVVVRSCSDGQTWRLVGECYLHGFMQGEAPRDVDMRKRQATKCTLI